MSSWRNLNTTGRLLVVCCIVNLAVAVGLALKGNSISAIFSTCIAAFCGLSTYSERYQIQDKKEK